jgi:hypothetical protein
MIMTNIPVISKRKRGEGGQPKKYGGRGSKIDGPVSLDDQYNRVKCLVRLPHLPV